MAMSFEVPRGSMVSSAALLPLCSICKGNAQLVNTIRQFGDRPEVHILECTACRHNDMYALIDGTLERF